MVFFDVQQYTRILLFIWYVLGCCSFSAIACWGSTINENQAQRVQVKWYGYSYTVRKSINSLQVWMFWYTKKRNGLAVVQNCGSQLWTGRCLVRENCVAYLWQFELVTTRHIEVLVTTNMDVKHSSNYSIHIWKVVWFLSLQHSCSDTNWIAVCIVFILCEMMWIKWSKISTWVIPEVLKMTTSRAATDDKVVQMMNDSSALVHSRITHVHFNAGFSAKTTTIKCATKP